MTAEDSPAQDRSTAAAGAAPPSRGSRRISASRASCIASGCDRRSRRPPVPLTAPSLARGGRRPARAERHRGLPRPAAGAATAGRPPRPAPRPSPGRRRPARRRPAPAGPRPGCMTAGSAVQARTLVASITGSVRPRCAAATAPRAWSRVSTPPGAGGHPAGGAAASSPIAISRSSAAAVRAGSTPVAAKRSRTASQGSGVRSRCHTRWLRTPAPRSSSGRSVSTTSHWPRTRSSSASRTASADTHGTTRTGTSAWVNVGEPGPFRAGPDPEHARRRSPCGAPGPAAPAGPEAWPGSPSRSLLHPPLHDHLLVAVRRQGTPPAARAPRWRRRPWPGSPGRQPGLADGGGDADGHVVRAQLVAWSAPARRPGPSASHSKIASSAAARAGPSRVANSSAADRLPQRPSACSRPPGRARRPASRPRAAGRACPSGTRPPPRPRPPPGSASSRRGFRGGQRGRARVSTRWTRLLARRRPPPGQPRRGRSPAGPSARRQAGRGAGRQVPPGRPGQTAGSAAMSTCVRRVSVKSATPAAVRYGFTRIPNSDSAREVAACQSAGAGSGSGFSSMSGRVDARPRCGDGPVLIPGPLPQRGPGQHDQVGDLVPQAQLRADRVDPAPDLPDGDCVLGLQAVAGRRALELRAPGAEPVVAEQEMRLASHADLQRVGDPADGGDVALQPHPPVLVGDGPLDVRIHGGQIPHGDLDVRPARTADGPDRSR